MFIVVAYDIADDRRRVRVHKLLKDFGRPVQYSTFECLLEPSQLARLRARVERLTDGDLDAIAYYALCETCAQHTLVLSGVSRLQQSRLVIV